LDLANSSRRRSSLKDQDFRTIAKKLPLQTNSLQTSCKMSTQAVSRSPEPLKGSLKRGSAALGSNLTQALVQNAPLAVRHFVNRSSVSSWQSRCPQGPAGFSNRVGSPPTQPGGLLWLWERLGWSAIILAATESCEERDSPGIRPCGVTPAWPLFLGGGAASRVRGGP
jgi:hypothetical protein